MIALLEKINQTNDKMDIYQVKSKKENVNGVVGDLLL
jgi:hypothetical protein